MWKCEKCGREFKNNGQEHFCGGAPKSIDEYIEAQPEETRSVLSKIRKTIRAAAPEAVEKISWQMPTFWQGENLIHFAAFKKHFGLYPGDLTFTPFKDKLKDYITSKGTIQFPYDKPVPYDLIAEITAYRVEAANKNARIKNEKNKNKDKKNV